MFSFIAFILFSALLRVDALGLGFDTRYPDRALTNDEFTCLRKQFDIFTAHIFNSDGTIDESGAKNFYDSRDAFSVDNNGVVQGVISPCPPGNKCKNNLTSAADQEQFISAHFCDGNFMFIEVQEGGGWSTDQLANRNFITDLLNAFQYDFSCALYGIKTDYKSWSKIMGPSFTSLSQYCYIWWVDWNGKDDLTTNWTPFGGWVKPKGHQYSANVTNNPCVGGIPISYSVYAYDDFKLRRTLKK